MSVPFDARAACDWTGARLVHGDPAARLAAVSTDSRRLEGEDLLFVAIRGERFDGHGFLADAVAGGAAGLLVERADALPAALPAGLPVLAVRDTTRALGDLAAGHRRAFAGPVVAVTGSNGKTTTKEMCARILAGLGPCLRNRGNWNNFFGLPLTLLEREAHDRAVVVELGMNHRGEIARLAEIARPTIGVVTNVGSAHIEHLGSREAIAAEKGDLVAALPAGGVAVLNADDPRVRAMRERTPARVRTFGIVAPADVRAENVHALGAEGFAFDLAAPEGRAPVRVAGLGAPTVPNALAAAAAALAAGASPADVAKGLARVEPVAGRMAPVRLGRGVVVIDDSYNANPQSMEAALRSLALHRGRGRGVAVLGDMGELGETAGSAHREVGALAARLGLDALVVLGEHAADTADGARAAGMEPDRVHRAGDPAEAAARGVRDLGPGDWLLVKGSRSMRMERVVAALREAGGPPAAGPPEASAGAPPAAARPGRGA